MIKIRIMPNSEEIRECFRRKFLLDWEGFQLEYRDCLAALAKKNEAFRFEDALMWDKMPRTYPNPSFDEALSLLRTLEGEVCFMTEINESIFDTWGKVIAADARALADLIEYDWYEDFRAQEYFRISILPPDLYVFDQAMTHLLVFTHENDLWELEWTEPQKAAAARVCIACGFSPEDGETEKSLSGFRR